MSNNNSSNATSGGIGFTGLLTLVFIVLKLCNVINWSWWWVLSPLWISLAVGIAILLIVIVVAIICTAIEDRKSSNRIFRKK
jgi:membrane protein YdbS with pleckstrin-like domain